MSPQGDSGEFVLRVPTVTLSGQAVAAIIAVILGVLIFARRRP